MHALRSCDFCGADAAGAFEIVPPELEPTEAEQRRVVLCVDCKDRLEVLIEPLLARAGAEDETAAGDEADANDGESAGTDYAVATADDSTQKRDRTSSPNATVSEPDADPESGADSEPAESESETGSDDSADTDSSDVSLLEDGITFEHGDGADDSEVDAAEVAELVAATDGKPDSGAPAENDAGRDGADEGDEPDAESTDAPTSPPPAYGKVVRLLRNREFPMQRRAVEELAAGAYDLEDDEVEAIIDYALEDGEFVEERGMLSRP
ncbi:hypothetical protein [Natrinema sp. 1APR25-10V2]|uniref:hypothetical protein n=1 Tax=Natrinema sp. 1APR25-10V2 TaxID=2951081 RepID=UPI002876757D|nr:hypothetical protein [Natrinema sp. 1APR25-10V2]MDS0476232.1 hypothetical protein [Natrinema sp. 1APR25-10V2]